MDVTFNNVMEGMRQYFMGVPKQAQAEGSGQTVWPAGTPLLEEGAPAQSGAPAPSSRPPSAAAAPPSTPTQMAVAIPPRPPSEPLEPEPHIIHKATVMREAAEKRREMPEVEDEEEPIATLSPPSHFIRKPQVTQPSPAPAPPVHCPSPSRPPSAALPPPSAPEPPLEAPTQYRPPVHRVPTPTARPPDQFAPGRPPDPYTTSRPPESYGRYHYESNIPDGGRNSHGPPNASPQPSIPTRHSPQTYARLSNSIPHHNASRLRESTTHSPPAQRYNTLPSAQPPPLHNDRVPPIHHPQTAPPPTRFDIRSTPGYTPHLQQRREPSPYSRSSSHYERHPPVPAQKYDPQQAYSGYRPTTTNLQPVQNHRVESHHAVQYKQSTVETINSRYGSRTSDRVPIQPQPHMHDTARLQPRVDYANASRNIDARCAYSYPIPSTSTSRYAPSAPVPVVQNTSLQSRSSYRPATAPKTNYEYPTSSPIQTSPARSTAKPVYPNQQARMTVSVTSLVNQMNQTKHKRDSPHSASMPVSQINQVKQKRESPLDLSVKTVKNSADSSTTQDDIIDSPSMENKTLALQARPTSSNRQNPPVANYVGSHKVDFAPNFTQYRERSNHTYSTPVQSSHQPVRYNGTYETRRPVPESYSIESPHQIYRERSKYNSPIGRADHVPRIDLTRPNNEQHHHENRIRDDRHFIIEERKRPAGPIVSNIPEKIVRYETWTSNGRIERMSQSDKEQHELMSRPVYSYSSHKQFEAYQNEQKRPIASNVYRDHHSQVNHRYPNNAYPTEIPNRETSDYHSRYHDRNSSSNRNQVIQKIPSHRDIYPHHLEPHNGVPADKRVLSILRNSLETKQGFVEPSKHSRSIPDLIVIDDVDDSVIEITDLTKDNDIEPLAKDLQKPIQNQSSNLGSHIQMPKAVDSLQRDNDYNKLDNTDLKSKSPEYDVASRIRTKAELKVMPPSQESTVKVDDMQTEHEKTKLLPKSQKQHLFNQIREDNLRLESVIKSETPSEIALPEVKSEPMNIDEIEKDAEISIKTENILDNFESEETLSSDLVEDLDWASACDNFMEQLKTGCHKKKSQRKRIDTSEHDSENKIEKNQMPQDTENTKAIENDNVNDIVQLQPDIVIKQEPADDYDTRNENEPSSSMKDKEISEDKLEIQQKHDAPKETPEILKENLEVLKENLEIRKENPEVREEKVENKNEKIKTDKKNTKNSEKPPKVKTKTKVKLEKNDPNTSSSTVTIKKEMKDKESVKPVIKEELESTDDDEPLIKSKLLKEKEQSDRLKYQLLKDLSEKSAYVKLECCDVDVNKNNRKSIDSISKDKEEKQNKSKSLKHTTRVKGKSLSIDNNKNIKQNGETSSDSEDDDELSVASRLRVRKSIKTDETKNILATKTPIKSSSSKKQDNSGTSNDSTPIRKPGFGDGSDFHPGWEEELYRYKRSLRMPTRLIAIPRGRSGGPFIKGSGALFSRGTTSLPDLDPAPLSPAPSSTPSAATDDLYSRRPDKLTLDSDLDSNSSCSAPHRLHYDSEASTSTIFSSSKVKKKGSSIVDVLIQKCGRREDSKKKSKDKDERTPKVIPKGSSVSELLPTPSLGLIKNGNKNSLSVKKEKIMEDIFYLGAFRKETVTAFRNEFIKNTDGLIGATEEFAPVVLKSRTRTESRVLKQRATMKEVFGDERPASAPPSSCREIESQEVDEEQVVQVKSEPKEQEVKPKFKPKKILKDKIKRRSSSIRDGLRSTKSLKRNDAKGRLLRLKKRNSLMKSLPNKRIKDISLKHKKENTSNLENRQDKPKEESSSLTEGKRRLKRLFGRRKFSSGFDYIRKKKKIIRREDQDTNTNKIRRPAVKPSPESVHDIHKEIKSWIVNKSIGETHLHRAAKLGFTDCVAYCLEKMSTDPSAKDNAGFTPLHVAAAKGHVRIARLLLQYGANVSAAAQGGIRPLHEAAENCHVEVIRLLLSYGADPLLGTYAGQTPEELAEGQSARLIHLHIADVQGKAIEPWRFPHPAEIFDREEMGCDPLSSPPPSSPPPPPDSTIEIQCTEAPLPPFYTLRTVPGQPSDGLWCLLQDVTNLLQIKSKDSLLKQIHCGSGSPRELLREIRTQEFLERAQCHQLLCAGEKVNIRASKVALVRVTDKLRQLLKIETILVS